MMIQHEHHAPAPDPHAGHDMGKPAAEAKPPAIATDHAAERFYAPEAMAAARAQLMKEHGGGTAWTVRADVLGIPLSQGRRRPGFRGRGLVGR
jgi:copper resistance protein B